MDARPEAHNGFTLLEVIVVLLLVAVLGAVVVPRIGTIGAGVRAEAELLRANLRFVQALAITGNTATWSVQVEPGAYRVLRNGNPAPTTLPDEAGPARVLPPAVRIVSGTGAIVFDAHGAPASTVSIVLSDGQRNETVTVIGFTGLIP